MRGLIAHAMGLEFPPSRTTDMKRGLAGAALEFGYADLDACLTWLLSAPLTAAQQQVLANHLTVGETYFFRDSQVWQVLRERLVPELIRSRRGRDQRLRVWSAGCCTGEEAYSLAILLHESLPDAENWRVTVLATDLNATFLRKADAGAYGQWSFRSAPDGFKERYFKRGADGRHVIAPKIRKMVTFSQLNLLGPGCPSPATDAMDLIFCRNVLMYFATEPMQQVIGKLHGALVPGGVLAVGPAEASHARFPQFVPLTFPNVTLYQKRGPGALPTAIVPPPPTPPPPTPAPPPWSAPFAAPPQPEPEAEPAPTLHELAARAREYANQGELGAALSWCDRWLAADKLDPGGHYLRAVILLEQGAAAAARRSLQHAIYLRADYVQAHLALGNLARSGGRSAEATRHFRNALDQLSRYQPGDLIPEAEGLTAGGLAESITALIARGNAP